jgi:transposase
VVFEEGPLSGRLTDALSDVADDVVSCDPAHNALIARAEDSNDERDARRLALLARTNALRPVFVPPEPYRTLRSLIVHDRNLQKGVTRAKNRIKALCRRTGVRYHGKGVYLAKNRAGVLAQIPETGVRWQMNSLYRELDFMRKERNGVRRTTKSIARHLEVIDRLDGAPGVGAITARTVVAWVVDPGRFRSRKALASYAGLGLGQGWTNWQPTGPAKASKRGQRELKRVLFLAANAAVKGHNALARRYQARQDAGWEHSKAIRDTARTLLYTLAKMWKTRKDYDDERVSVPTLKER